MLLAASSSTTFCSRPVWSASAQTNSTSPRSAITTLLDGYEPRVAGPVGLVSVPAHPASTAGSETNLRTSPTSPTSADEDQSRSNRRATLLAEIEALRLWQRNVGRPPMLTWIVKTALDRRVEELARLDTVD